MKQLFVLLIIILNIGIVHLSAQPMKELEQLVSITFFEKTNNTFEHMYDIEDVRLNERLDGNLNSSNFDFQGTPNREFYDVYYSDGDGILKQPENS